MRKAINLTIKLWIEGDDEPAHNFAQSTSKPCAKSSRLASRLT